MQIIFTEHAVDRYIERHDPSVDRAEARLHLDAMAHRARLVPLTTDCGGQLVHVAPENIYMVVKEDPNGTMCITVLQRGVLVHGINSTLLTPDEIAAVTIGRGERIAARAAAGATASRIVVTSPPPRPAQRARPRSPAHARSGVEVWGGRPGCPAPATPPDWTAPR